MTIITVEGFDNIPPKQDRVKGAFSEQEPADVGAAIYVAIKASVKETMLQLTSHDRMLKTPNPHRPEVMISGLPRKRGKGKR